MCFISNRCQFVFEKSDASVSNSYSSFYEAFDRRPGNTHAHTDILKFSTCINKTGQLISILKTQTANLPEIDVKSPGVALIAFIL